MFHSVLPLLVIGITAGAAVVSLLFGDDAARIAGGINFLNAVALPLYRLVSPGPSGEVLQLAGDFFWAVGLLILVVRHASLWLGVTMLLQSVQFGLHAYYIVMELPHDLLHAWVNNLDEVGISACIIIGTMFAIGRRVRIAREQRELAPRTPTLSRAM